MAVRTWACPACNRRVPETVPVCRCGASRVEADFKQAAREMGSGPRIQLRNEPLPREIKAWLVVIGLALLGGLVFAVRSDGPPGVAPLLGWSDERPPSPSPYRYKRQP